MNTTTTLKSLSPFSNQHKWVMNWEILSSNQKGMVFEINKKEKVALEAIASIGVIGGLQLSRLFQLNKKQISKMVYQGKLIRHEIKRNKMIIPVYTLGSAGITHIIPKNIENYWTEYSKEEVLKRLSFFQFYELFPKGIARIAPAQKPFSGAIYVKQTPFFVYVARGNIDDLILFLKYQSFTERLMIVVESLEELKPLNLFVNGLKVRATTDEDLKKGFQNAFYVPKFNQTTREIEWMLESTLKRKVE